MPLIEDLTNADYQFFYFLAGTGVIIASCVGNRNENCLCEEAVLVVRDTSYLARKWASALY